MPHDSHSLETLRLKGHRITATRKAILEVLADEQRPLSASEIHASLSKRGRKADKVTVYREMDFLEKEGLAVCVRLGDRNRRYELSSREHHHHLVCQKCEKVEDIQLDEDFEAQERKIVQQTHFKVLRHSLEFFGLCKTCA